MNGGAAWPEVLIGPEKENEKAGGNEQQRTDRSAVQSTWQVGVQLLLKPCFPEIHSFFG